MKKKIENFLPKIHPDFPDYLIYPDGRIKSILKKRWHNVALRYVDNFMYGQFLKIRVHPKYKLRMIGLTDKDGIVRTRYIHRLVAQTFLKKVPGKNHVWFKDDNRDNCHFSNLLFVDQGDLNHIQVRLGTRDMIKQAATMRKRRLTFGRRPGGRMINGKYVLPKK